MKNNKFVALWLTPVFASIIIFMVVPIVWGLALSFTNYRPLAPQTAFVGVDNFKKLLSDKVFNIALKNTLIFVFVTVALNIVITLGIAQFISTLGSNKTRSLLRAIFFMPCVAPLVASSIVWKQMYSTKYGLINTLLNSLFNMPHKNWLGSPDTVLPALIIFTLWADIGFNVIIFSAGMDGIPTDFYESAAIDGAGNFAKFFYVTLPLLSRTLCFVVTMTLISHFQMFAQFDTMTRVGNSSGGPANAGMVLTLNIYKTAFKYKEMGYASAMAMVLFVIILICSAVSQRLNRVDWSY
ncbi:MAG: sugar ABC transporter permease [Oscillospiraceae bacterium]|nr:sugar ABC transporter permease [Oscillospiraceae bacterium]